MVAMILDAKPLDNELRNTFRGPHIACKTMRFRPLRQLRQQLLLLLGTQVRPPPRWFVVPQGLQAACLGTGDDPTDRTLGQIQGISYLTLLVALLVHSPGPHAPIFTPVLWFLLFRGVHTPFIPRSSTQMKDLPRYQ